MTGKSIFQHPEFSANCTLLKLFLIFFAKAENFVESSALADQTAREPTLWVSPSISGKVSMDRSFSDCGK